MMSSKTCTCCGETFSATTEYFYKDKRGKYGLYSECKTCRKSKMDEYIARPEVKAKRLGYMVEYNARPKVKAKMAEYQAKPEVKAKRAEYRARPEAKAKRAEYRARPEVKAKTAEYNARSEAKAKKAEYKAEYDAKPENKSRRNKLLKERRKTDPDFRLTGNMRKRFYNWLTSKNADKQCSVFDLTDCTLSELWDHLESKFQTGMTRENYGEWHVDHIIPLSKFDPSCWMQMSVAWDVDNLQPLWAKDNCSKGDKLDWSKCDE